MNLQEFAALKVGDLINNPFAQSSGVVSEVIKDGVKVHWGHSPKLIGAIHYTYTVNSTAWFHWSKAGTFTVQERNPANCEHGVAMDIFCELCEPGK